MKTRSGFTLIELLVVIAVIAVLAGIIFPVYAGAQRKAESTHCLSNLRQLGIALRAYANDHQSRLPDWGPAGGGMATIAADWRASDPGGGAPNFRDSLGRVATSLMGSYTGGSYEVFFCPAGIYETTAEATLPWGSAAAVEGGEIGYCSLANWATRDGRVYTRLMVDGGQLGKLGSKSSFVERQLDLVSAPGSDLCLLADNGLFTAVDGEALWPHDNVGNVLLVDGSVRSLPRSLFLSGYAPIHADPAEVPGYDTWRLDAVE